MDFLVSVIIPAYNSEAYLERALDSVIAQTYGNFEVIVVNDGSSDRTQAIAARYSKDDSRIRLFNKANGGVSSARNVGLKEAAGDYFAFLDADDFWLSDHLASLFPHLESFGAVVASPQWVDEQGQLIGAYPYGPDLEEITRFPVSLAHHNFINPSWLAIQRAAYELIGGFDEDPRIQHAEDWDFALRMVEAGVRFKFSGSETVMYRRHSVAATSNAEHMAKVCLFCISKHVEDASSEMQREFGISRSRQLRKLSRVYRKRGELRALKFAWLAWLQNPTQFDLMRNLLGAVFYTSKNSMKRSNSQ